MTDRITRAAIEQLLHELSGFKADSASIAAAMVVIDTYAASQSETISESQLHLLYQQSELLLDSSGSLSVLRNDIGDLGERVTQLATTILASQQALIMPQRVELTELEREIVLATLPPQEVAAEPELPGWERELLDELYEEQEAGIREVDGYTEVYCHTCGEWKHHTEFYRNQKSKTGYEGKCRTCRPARRKAA